MHYRMNNSNDYGHLRVRSNIVRLRGSQILSRVYLFDMSRLGISFNAAEISTNGSRDTIMSFYEDWVK